MALLGGCAADPSVRWLGGIGDPVRGTALNAPNQFGDFPRWRGDPAGAARAAAQLEFLADAFRNDPRFAPQVDPGVVLALQRARAELRDAVGIAADAAPQAVIARLRGAAAAIDAGSPSRAEAALASAEFDRPPRAVLAALGAAPALPRAREAASLAAAEIMRLGQRG